SKTTMREHWASGLDDIRRSFGHPEWFEIPSREIGFVTRDVHRYRQDASEIGHSGTDALPATKHAPEEAPSVARERVPAPSAGEQSGRSRVDTV
ncbi:DUF3734 domain-containing protein, partial [Burkholderia sp.]